MEIIDYLESGTYFEDVKGSFLKKQACAKCLVSLLNDLHPSYIEALSFSGSPHLHDAAFQKTLLEKVGAVAVQGERDEAVKRLVIASISSANFLDWDTASYFVLWASKAGITTEQMFNCFMSVSKID